MVAISFQSCLEGERQYAEQRLHSDIGHSHDRGGTRARGARRTAERLIHPELTLTLKETDMNQQITSRSGGRAARRAARSAALPDNLRPVRAGLEGGKYKPLSEIDVQKIHRAALDALETIGLADAPPSGIAHLTGTGAILGEDGRIRFPRALVEDTLARANRSITLMSRDGLNDLDLSGTRVHYGTAGAAVVCPPGVDGGV